MALLLNDSSNDAPKLRLYINIGNLSALPETSAGAHLRWPEAENTLKADGFEGIQLNLTDPLPQASDFPACGMDRINLPSEAESVFARHQERGENCLTLHVGWGMEDDDAIDRLVEAVLKASATFDLPAFIETHRATVTQDIWRTVRITERFPEVRFNGDFSHYYCGQEMVYGSIENKLDFMQPIFDRIGFMHGRIAAPGFMQAPIDSPEGTPAMATGADYLAHFKEMWHRAMAGFKRHASKGDVLIFAPELLQPDIYYARVFPDQQGRLTEESDRYAQALLYLKIARQCFNEA